MRVHRMFASAMLASALAQAEPLPPRLAERYRQMLAANPAEGLALDRLWKGAIESGTSEALIASYRGAQDFSGHMIFALLLRKAGRDDEARAAFELAEKADVASPLPPLAIGRMELERARPREAAAAFAKALALLPQDEARVQDVLMQLGGAWSASGEAAKAAEVWARMVALAPEDLEVRRRLVQSCVDGGQPALALAHLEFLATHAEPSERAKALQQMASLHSAAGRNAEAMQALERAVRGTAPGNWLRAELLGQIIRLAQRMHTEDALEKKWLAHAEENPRDLGGYLQLVEFYGRIGNSAQERAWLEKVTALVPGNAELSLRLARLLAQMDQLEAAAAQFDKLSLAQPKNTDLVFERARLDLRLEDGTAARRRIGAMLAAHRDDDLLRSAALGFFEEHRLLDSIEEHLRADAQAGAEEAVIALAEFYFSQRKNDEARAVLARVLRGGDAPAEAARRHALVAQHLKGHGELTAAVAEMEEAVRLAPGSREALLLLGELRALLAQHAEAKAAFVRAYAASRSDAERMEVDGKLFESIRASATAGEGRAQGAPAAAQVEGYIRDLMAEANDAKSPAGWLRVARWKAWNGDKSSAVTFAAKAADMEPKNPAAREFLARHAAANGEGAYAVAYLRELIEINPAGRDGYLREIAQIELQRGDHADALAIFAQLAKSNPGSMDALADLALAQERAEKTSEAAATWRRVLALAPAPRRREVSSSLVRVLEKLGAHEEAAALLLRGADEAGDERTRFARLDEVLLYSQRHARLPRLRDIFEKRRGAKADDYVAAIALGRVLKLMGEKAAAFETFADAALMTPNDADVLPELVREAEELRKPGLAVRLQEQFVRTAKVEHSDAWLRLAALQIGSGDLEGTERTWTQAVAKFPRDPDVLRRAADFHALWGERATAAVLLGKICALDAADIRAAAELGELEFAAGRLAEARVAFERVMKLTPPVAVLVYPPERTRHAARGSISDPSGAALTAGISPVPGTPMGAGARHLETDAQFRLGALRRLAEIARRTGGAILQKWIADWTPSVNGENTEAIWALHFSGAHEAALSLVEKNAATRTDRNGHARAFVAMAFESGLFARLAAWLDADDRTADDMEVFSTAFTEVLHARPDIVSPAMMEGLFPENSRARLWPCAMELARTKHTREAIALGRRALKNAAAPRAVVGRELARWHLALGEADDARAMLSAACEGAGESLESPVYGAMRDLYFVLPPEQRAAFVRERFRKANDATMHGLNVRALLFALEGKDAEARAMLSQILARRPIGPGGQEEGNSALREWNFANGMAAQLLEWSLPALAQHVLGVALADEGLRAVQAQQPVRLAPSIESIAEPWSERPIFREAIQRGRAQRDALAYLAGGAIEREALLAKVRNQADAGAWSRFAEGLESTGGKAHAVAVWKSAWELDPENPGALRTLLEASRAAEDVTTGEAVRRRCIDERINFGNDTTPREFALELADLLEARGALADALAEIERAVERNPEELRLLMRKAQLLERSGRADDAAAIWKKMIGMDGGTAYTRIALASILEERGKFTEAIEVRTRAGSSGDTALPELLCKNGNTDDALVALERLTGSAAVQAAMAVAEVLALRGEGSLARSVLVAATAKTGEPRALLQVRAKLLTIPGVPPTRDFRARMQARMREAAREHRDLSAAYFQFFDRYAARFGIADEWQREVESAWATGSGDAAAGITMLRRAFAKGDAEAARRTCTALLQRADFLDASLDAMRALARETGRADLQLLIAEKVARDSWPSADGMLEDVRALAANGARERAAEVLGQHAWLCAFAGGAEALGRAWLALGDAVQARNFLARAMAESGRSPSPAVLAAMAKVQIVENHFPAARLLLRRAFAEPVCHEYATLAEYFEASGELREWEKLATEFSLSARALHEMRLAIFALHEKQARIPEALALVAAAPSLVSAAGRAGREAAIDCARLRRLAAKSGDFDAGAKVLGQLAAAHHPDAASELEALRADWSERRGDREEALLHLERSAGMRPGSWEFARRAAEMRLGRGEAAEARAMLERFLAVAQSPTEREAALELWEKAHAASVGSAAKAGSLR